jgi:predicted nucleic acid-binding protein
VAIVVDASIVLAALLGEAGGAAASALAEAEWVVPSLWWFEIRNGLIVNECRRRTSEQLSASSLRELSQITTTVDAEPDGDRLMALARRHRLTVYDAAYLELALRQVLPLATLDAALIDAARAEGVPLLGDSLPEPP